MSDESANWLNDQDVKVPEGVPEPTLWRVLVMPVQPRRRSRGTHGVSIELAANTQDSEGYLNYIGKVVLLGPLAGKNEKFENPEWAAYLKEYGGHMAQSNDGAPKRYLWDVKVGDWVIYGRYAGQRMEYEGVKLVMTNDDEILGTVSDPSGFRIYA